MTKSLLITVALVALAHPATASDDDDPNGYLCAAFGGTVGYTIGAASGAPHPAAWVAAGIAMLVAVDACEPKTQYQMDRSNCITAAKHERPRLHRKTRKSERSLRKCEKTFPRDE